MNITSIEVIRQGVAPSIRVAPGEKVQLNIGDTLRVRATLDYRGPAISATFYGAIGNKIIGIFDEYVHGSVLVSLGPSTDWITYELTVDIPTAACPPGNNFDIYVKLVEYLGVGVPEVTDVIDIDGIPPAFELIQHTIHPADYVYEGEAEICTIEFPLTPDQFPFTQWGGLKIAEAFANAVEAEGNSLLEVKVYEDITPVFWTNYRVEIKAAVASEEQGIAVWPWLAAIGAVLVALPWAKIILGVLAILGIWVVGWIVERLIKGVDRVIHVPPTLTEEEKLKLPREDLIKMILYQAQKVDYEVSSETLEEMSDDGLRALLNELIAEAAPPAEWWPLVLIGGLGVLGVGVVAVALATRPKE